MQNQLNIKFQLEYSLYNRENFYLEKHFVNISFFASYKSSRINGHDIHLGPPRPRESSLDRIS